MYKCCGKNPIIEPEEAFAESNLSSEEVELLIDVYRTYDKPGWALKEMTHRPGGPWAQVYQKGMNRTISQESMKAYHAGEALDSFDLDKFNIPVITEVPAEWDTPADSVYD